MGALSIYRRMEPASAIKALGKIIKESGMFGAKGQSQSEVMAWECLSRGVPPSTLLETYHVINSKLSIKTEKIVSNFNKAGGEHQILVRNSEEAKVRLVWNGHATEFSYTWAEAQGEPHSYNNKEQEAVDLLLSDKPEDKKKLKLKPKYATPHSRMQMLWVRLIGDAIRAVHPASCEGCYTSDEVADFTEDNDDVIDAEYTVFPSDPSGQSSDEQATDETFEQNADDQPAETAAELVVEAPFVETTVSPTKDKFSTAEQSQRLNDLYIALELTPEQIHKALKKRNAAANRSLMFDAAAELIGTLENALANKQLTAGQVEAAAKEVVGESRKDPNNLSTNPAGPATKEQCDEAKALLKELAQTTPAQFNRWKAHMDLKGLKIADLSAADAAVLLGDLHSKNMSAFFDLSLQKYQPAEGDSKN